MCCTSAKNLLRLVLLGGLVLFGGSVQLLAEEASKAAGTPAADTAHGGGHTAHDTGVPLKFKDDLAFWCPR